MQAYCFRVYYDNREAQKNSKSFNFTFDITYVSKQI